MKILKFVFSFILVLTLFTTRSQSLDDVYTTWAAREVPVAHQNIVNMIDVLWPDNPTKAAPLIEAHCKSLNQILMKVQSGDINVEYLQKALDKWTRAPKEKRSKQWWEWPDTNWIRVELEYNQLSKSG